MACLPSRMTDPEEYEIGWAFYKTVYSCGVTDGSIKVHRARYGVGIDMLTLYSGAAGTWGNMLAYDISHIWLR